MRTKVIFLASVAVGGCSFSSSSAPIDSSNIHHDMAIDTPIDASIDTPPDGPVMDFGPAPFTVHLSTLPTATVMLPAMINTDTSPLCSTTASWVSSTQPAATCFVVATSITSAGGTTTVTGSKPLVLVATSMISLTKPLDVSSKRTGATLGGGGNYNLCDNFTATPSTGGNGAGGGAGGTFLTQGGPGGIGDSNNAIVGGTAASPVAAPLFLRGGCPGQKGGNGNAGAPGNGGGAVYLVAATSITLSATSAINASGAGGTHGGNVSGGSGGGTGGMIVLDAPAITATGATLMANGGGASSGGDNNSNGRDGGDPTMTGAGGTGGIGPGGSGGNGGAGSSGGTGGGGGANNQGGGGGGGGVGYIRSNVTLTGAIASPAPDVIP